VIKDYYPN